MEIVEEETWNDRDRWNLCPKLDLWTIGNTRLDDDKEEEGEEEGEGGEGEGEEGGEGGEGEGEAKEGLKNEL